MRKPMIIKGLNIIFISQCLFLIKLIRVKLPQEEVSTKKGKAKYAPFPYQ